MPFYHHIHCKYTGIRGILTVYNHYLKYKYMISEKALKKARILVFWEKHGLAATQDAFPVKKRTLYLWKAKWHKANGKLEALNDISKVPKTKRTRVWDEKVIAEIKRLRWDHPNLGKDSIAHCEKNL